MTAFRQRTSFLRRQTIFVGLVIGAFALQAAGVYLASSALLAGLTRVSGYNRLYDYTTQTLDALTSATAVLEKSAKRTDVTDLDRVFAATFRETEESLTSAILLSQGADPGTRAALEKARATLRSFEIEAHAAFGATMHQKAETTHLLLARQYALEFSDALRKAQLRLRDENARVFEATYAGRYFPTMIGLLLAILSALGLLGFSVYANRQLRRSIRNLLSATDTVAAGDLRYRAPILVPDELGRVTAAVNDMVGQLEFGRDRLERLQSVTAAFSEALSKEGVADVVMSQVLQTLDAQAATIVQLNPGGELQILFSSGHDPRVIEAWQRFSIDRRTPVADAIRERRAIWIESGNAFRKEYGDSVGTGLIAESYIALPLLIGRDVIGGIGLGFGRERTFSREDQSFCLSLARQCAQALTRADLYDQSQAAVRMRDEFLSIASHELRTPLTPLKMQIQGLMRLLDQGRVTSDEPTRLAKMFGTAHAQIVRLTRLVDELLDTTRIEGGKLNLDLAPGDLSALLTEITERFTGSREAAANLAPDGTPVIRAIEPKIDPGLIGTFDRFRMDQVVTNLLTNAIKYSDGKTVELGAHATADGYEISVRDQGIGIATADQARIFDRFERAASSLNYGGLGLGLYIARQIVERHGGTIRVESAIGHGSRFVVALPRSGLESRDSSDHRQTSDIP